MVFSRKSHDEIIEKGIWERKVKTFQFPIKPSFSPRRESRTVLRRRLGLALKPFTVLFFFGAEGVGPVKKILATLIQRGLAMQAVVICGRNERLKKDIESLAKGPTGALQIDVRGYVTNLAECISAADVVVGKSGPNQVFETLVQGRPIIISSFLANEKETTNWVIGNKVGWLTRTPSQLATLLAKLAARPDIIAHYQDNIRALKLRSGAPEICQFLYGLIKDRKQPKKKTVGDTFRKLRDAVVAEGEAFSRRIEASIEASEGMQRMKRAAKSRQDSRTERRGAKTSGRRPAGGSPRPKKKSP
jgi:processive 1,2-diacylglycerol beta-glucosyltransferase